MTSFKTDIEATVDQKAQLIIPDWLADAYFLYVMKWTYWEYLATPHHIIEQIRFVWHLENVRDKAESRKANKK